MPLPPQQEFTLKNAALELRIKLQHLEELVSTGKFQRIIDRVRGDILHVYFDQGLWIKDYGEKVMLDPASQEKEYQESVKSQQAYLEKQLEEARKLYRADLEKKYGAKQGPKLEREYIEWEKQHGGQIKFDPTTLQKQYDKLYKTFHTIGPNELAILWESSKPWTPRPGAVVCIPQIALETFRAAHPESIATPTTDGNFEWIHVKELRIAVEVYYALYVKNERNPKLRDKKDIFAWLEKHHKSLAVSAKERIAVLVNPNKAGGAPRQ